MQLFLYISEKKVFEIIFGHSQYQKVKLNINFMGNPQLRFDTNMVSDVDELNGPHK